MDDKDELGVVDITLGPPSRDSVRKKLTYKHETS